jgi:hypothetical protein
MRTITILVAGLVISGAMPATAATGAHVESRVTIAVCDLAGAGQQTLAGAEQIVNRMYRKAGIAINWVNGCATSGAEDLRLNILGGAAGGDAPVPEASLGYAVAATRTANVRLDRIIQLSVDRHVYPSDVTGAVIAHELGHLLLGPGAHAYFGIMRPAFDFSPASLSSLFFSRDQAARMGHAIAERAHPSITN